MKNKVLALSAAILMAAGAAFAFTQSNNENCCSATEAPAGCDVQAGTCCGVPCPASDACPIPCCK